ncbi:hypothetical protein [Sulfuricurvum sp.]|uniref:hypothetical protein n=1 Tax=Sulfuricurvum sp. TaxID=2025608 RepID=UPI002602FB7E|nr:hypothetical protein [Sulfuricurvum sp.]MDD4950857.1 hypothetical protein [Sulfuricurvum sp.]
MLFNALDHLPHIVLLRSDKIFHDLVQTLINGKKNIRNEIFKPLIDGVRDFYPNAHRLDDIELSIEQQTIRESTEEGINYEFDFLEPLFDRLLVIDGSKIYPQDEFLEEYISLITKISPSHLIGYKLAKLLYDDRIELRDLDAIIDMATPLGLRVRKNTEYADNHIHLKGAGYSPFNLMRLMNRETKEAFYTDSYLREQPRINEFSYLNNGTYSIGQVIDIARISLDFVYGSIVNQRSEYLRENLHKTLFMNRKGSVHIQTTLASLSKAVKLFPFFPKNSYGALLSRLVDYYRRRQYDKAHLIESVLMFYLFLNDKDSTLRYCIKLYLQATNILRSYMVMSQNIGLSHFSEYSGADIRQVDKRNGHNIASGIINSGTNYLHAKMGIRSDSFTIAETVGHMRYIFESAKKDQDVIFNFGLSSNKGREKKKKNYSLMDMVQPSFGQKRRHLKQEALALDDFLRNAIYKNVDSYKLLLKHDAKRAFVEKCTLKGKTIDLSSLVVAIDAVGKETHTPPEVFAPFFRYLRAQPKSIKNPIAVYGTLKHHPRLIITAHAGEDFNHIVSGMRSVAECVEYFGMGNGDRIGHALSLGIHPSDWLATKQRVFLTRGEHLDNLVWLSGVLKEIKAENSYLTRYILKIEDEAMQVFREVYGSVAGASVSDMYQAWEYRKNCPLTYFAHTRNEKQLYDTYSKSVLENMKNEKAIEIFERYHGCNQVRNKSNEAIQIEKKRIDEEVLKIYEMLQDYLIDKYARAGIIFETNPSSNIFTSTMSAYSNHPIFRFYPPKPSFLEKGGIYNQYGLRQGVASVTINSDDPAIFVTSIQNEFETLRRVAVERFGCTKKEADDWLEDIRKFGINIFKESYVGNC